MGISRKSVVLVVAGFALAACNTTSELSELPSAGFTTGSISTVDGVSEEDQGQRIEISTRELESPGASATDLNDSDAWVRVIVDKESGRRQLHIDAYMVWTNEPRLEPLEAMFGTPATSSVVREIYYTTYCDPNPGVGCTHYEHVTFSILESSLYAQSANGGDNGAIRFLLANEEGRSHEVSIPLSEFAEALELARVHERTESL